jgi:hypothetical protein
LLLGVRVIVADPLAEVHEACAGLAWEIRQSVPVSRSGTGWVVEEAVSAAMEQSCKPLIERLSSLPSPSPEERLALIKARKGVIHTPKEEFCEEVAEIAAALPDHPDVLSRLALCAFQLLPVGTPEDQVRSQKVAHLERALELDPLHHDSLALMTVVRHPEDTYGLSAATMAQHRLAYYDVARGISDKLVVARDIYEAAKAGTDLESAVVAADIQERVRTDLGFDGLELGDAGAIETFNRMRADYGLDPVDPEFIEDFTHYGPLDWICSEQVFALDLEDICLSAIETVAEATAAAGRPLNHKMPGRALDNAFKHLAPGDALPDSKAAAQERLRAIYRDYPRQLWNYGHYRGFADLTAGTERLAALRGALERAEAELGGKPYYVRAAGCALARALWETGELSGAREHYEKVASTEPADSRHDHLPPLCDPAEALRTMAEFPGEPPPPEKPESPEWSVLSDW